MPLYEYECKKCHFRFERIQLFSAPLVRKCPKCKTGRVVKLLSAPAVQFKGTGWYVTDYAGKKGGSDKEGGKSEDGGKREDGGKSESDSAASGKDSKDKSSSSERSKGSESERSKGSDKGRSGKSGGAGGGKSSKS